MDRFIADGVSTEIPGTQTSAVSEAVRRQLQHTLIVVPAYNEERSVGAVVAEIFDLLPGAGCLVVDDGSADRTAEMARAAGAVVAVLPVNLGVGGAMRLGFRYALERGYSNVVQVDADGQHDPVDVLAMIAQLDSADVVIGARFAGQGDYEVSGPRRWVMAILSWVLSRIAGTTLSDTTSGLRACGPRAVRLFARHYPAEYLGDTIESLMIAIRDGCRIRQVPASMRPRAGGNPSQNAVTASLYLGRALIALLFSLIHPVSASVDRVRS